MGAVYLNDSWVPYQGKRKECPTTTTPYTWHIDGIDGTEAEVTVIITVYQHLPATPTPTPIISPTPSPQMMIEAEWPEEMVINQADSIRVSMIRKSLLAHCSLEI